MRVSDTPRFIFVVYGLELIIKVWFVLSDKDEIEICGRILVYFDVY